MIASLTLGVAIGSVWQSWRDDSSITMPQFNAPMPPEETILRLDKIINGKLEGQVQGKSIRLQITNNVVEILANGDFSTDIISIMPALKTVPHPTWAKFVASKRGKYFYALDNIKAQGINYKNRIFFPDRKAAEKLGYLAK